MAEAVRKLGRSFEKYNFSLDLGDTKNGDAFSIGRNGTTQKRM
jgi:hypothetical protein